MSINNNKPERRACVEVTEKKLELNGIVANILNFCMLAVLGWIGITITTMQQDVATMKTTVAVEAVERQNLERRLNEHISNFNNLRRRGRFDEK